VGVRDIQISGYYFNEFPLPSTIMPQHQMYHYLFSIFSIYSYCIYGTSICGGNINSNMFVYSFDAVLLLPTEKRQK